MAKYVKKSEIVEAKQYEHGMEDGYTQLSHLDYLKIIRCDYNHPDGLYLLDERTVPYIQKLPKERVIISKGDYIITNSNGEKTALSKKTFEKEYEGVATYAPIVDYPRNSGKDTINSTFDKASFISQFSKINYETASAPKINFRTFHVIVEGEDDFSSYEQEIGRITVAYQIKNDNEYKCALSFCSYRDKYSKHEGQRIAEERLKTDPICIVNNKLPQYKEDLKYWAIDDAKIRNISWMKGITVDNLK